MFKKKFLFLRLECFGIELPSCNLGKCKYILGFCKGASHGTGKKMGVEGEFWAGKGGRLLKFLSSPSLIKDLFICGRRGIKPILNSSKFY